jgi:hypothetical protein
MDLAAARPYARITGEAIVQADLGGGFRPFRRQAAFLATDAAPIQPLLDALTFIRNRTHWGAAFRFGFLRVPEQDFARIATAMGRDYAADFPGAPSMPRATEDPCDPPARQEQ